jgi:predicted O-linked N-acetylglucosamine transferase (SPINDLY family)
MSSLKELIDEALVHHRAGRLAEAEKLYRRVLDSAPGHADALHLLGVVAHSKGRSNDALDLIDRAIVADSGQASYHFNRGEVYRSLGRLAEARASYERAVALQPGHAQSWLNLGTVLQAAGELSAAEACYRRAVRARPGYALALNALGAALLTQGRLSEARVQLEETLRVQPDYVEALNNLGAVYQRVGEWGAARECLTRALRLRPEHALTHYNLGTLAQAEGDSASARAALERALQLKPQFPEVYYSLAGVFKEMMRFEEAENSLREALRLKPDFVDALVLLGNTLELQGRFDEAMAFYQQALARKSRDDVRIKIAQLLPVIYESRADLDRHRQRVEEQLSQLAEEKLTIDDPDLGVGGPCFFLAYHGRDDRALNKRLATLYSHANPTLHQIAPHCTNPRERNDGKRPIRIGFISKFFYYHTIAKLNLGFVQHLSREQFQVILFRFPGHNDGLAERIGKAADEVVTLPTRLDAARKLIAARELDVLFYTDIGMDPFTYFLAFARLAPVQCTTWGHPVTSGIPTMDYFLSNVHLETPDSNAIYTETLVRMRRINSYYFLPQLVGQVKPRSAFGLEEGSHLYVCPQTLYKLHPDFDSILGAILRSDPLGCLVFIKGTHEYWQRTLTQRFRRSFPDVADRVGFLPYLSGDDFLHLQAIADVLLDPIHFGGGNTSYEAFAVGTPIVTLAGPFLRSRITYACYQQMGITDCIARDPEDYVRIALRLAMDPAARADVSTRILAAHPSLYEDEGAVRELEQFFAEAVNRSRGTHGNVRSQP